MDALQEARNYAEQYEHRINQDTFHGDIESRLRYEDAAYKQAMMNAAIAQAEALERVAMHLGNIHQTLITPNASGEPVGVADLLGRIDKTLDHVFNIYARRR